MDAAALDQVRRAAAAVREMLGNTAEALGHGALELVEACEAAEAARGVAISNSTAACEEMADVFAAQLLAYCLEGEPINAKFLWLRLDNETAKSNSEVQRAYAVARALLDSDSALFFTVAREQPWPPLLDGLVQALVDQVRAKQLQLLASLFRGAVPLDRVVLATGLETALAIEHCKALGWTEPTMTDDSAGEALVAPTRPTSHGPSPIDPAKVRLLAHKVALLERRLCTSVVDIIAAEKARDPSQRAAAGGPRARETAGDNQQQA